MKSARTQMIVKASRLQGRQKLDRSIRDIRAQLEKAAWLQ